MSSEQNEPVFDDVPNEPEPVSEPDTDTRSSCYDDYMSPNSIAACIVRENGHQ